ncbi:MULTISPECIES: hypothetical protein [unclassified Streptomyces]|uniref:hypothetical protein n=1 Tax=unclassified Streptomyces TaxID=2593676 RepID=UPI0033985DA6
MPPAFVHRITKYDPADRDEHGSYRGAEEAVSDHGPVEAAYLEAISAFAEAADIDRLEIREPSVTGLVHFGAQPAVEGHGLSGLFPADLTGYYDGAEVSLAVALELIRVMLREQGAWCRLEAGDVFTVQMRIKDKDAYWLDTRMDDGGTCRYGVGGGQPVICELVAQ